MTLPRAGSIALGLLLAPLAGVWTAAQAQFPPCPPPAANEYLLLVRSNTEAERTRVQNLLPSNSTVLVCDYLNDTVVRAGGFTNLENANAWAQYMTEVEGFQAFVARPATIAAQPTPPTGGTTPPTSGTTPPADGTSPNNGTPAPGTAPATTQTAPTTYAPQPLGTGFAVLVDYQYQPESAIAIQRQVGQAVGLAVHRQRSYLLIAHSPDVAGAASTLSVLTGLNIPGFIVDSQEVVMLTPAVALTAP
ncbi:hypothetical protein VB780_19135 [Leptolyngbya sp. CCNP1308]|uniref:hypothetical protein n=1 Tax=Leptolyngbya sp. CCNP1308 TaxID=3110255 RepID=UPI002B1EA1C5|nr:hypothetical protein [Leptolyngbya sp. CCNP1308]MEA5450702.1 hypothetical protein [Leptolyngbya sp. CCNP1308]